MHTRPDEAKFLFDRGLSTPSIAETMKVTTRQARRLLQFAGVIRSVGRPARQPQGQRISYRKAGAI